MEHIPDRHNALRRMISAIRPGGWTAIEDTDFGGVMSAALAHHLHPPEHSALFERMLNASASVLTNAAADASLRGRITGALKDAGLQNIAGEVHSPILPAGTRYGLLSLERIAERLVGTGLGCQLIDGSHHLRRTRAEDRRAHTPASQFLRLSSCHLVLPGTRSVARGPRDRKQSAPMFSSASGTPTSRQYLCQLAKPAAGGSSGYPGVAAQNRASASGSVQSVNSCRRHLKTEQGAAWRIPVTVATLACFGSCNGRSRKARSAATER